MGPPSVKLRWQSIEDKRARSIMEESVKVCYGHFQIGLPLAQFGTMSAEQSTTCGSKAKAFEETPGERSDLTREEV